MKAFKVVRKHPLYGYISAFCVKSAIFPLEERGITWLEYRLGVETIPKFGGIFAFENVEQAAKFWASQYRRHGETFEIMEGQGEKSLKKPKTQDGTFQLDGFVPLETFWQDNFENNLTSFTLPEGTVLLNSFKPLSMSTHP